MIDVALVGAVALYSCVFNSLPGAFLAGAMTMLFGLSAIARNS